MADYKHPLYMVYKQMIARCYSPKTKGYCYNGALGVTVCDRWLKSFDDYVDDVGARPQGCILGRLDKAGPYSPENCAWMLRAEQFQRHTDTSQRLFEYDGEMRSIGFLAKVSGVDYHVLAGRLVKQKWTVERAMTAPVGPWKRTDRPRKPTPRKEKVGRFILVHSD